jgi:hypothetical protein
MAIDPIALIFATAVGQASPAVPPSPSLAGLTLDYDRIAVPVALDNAPITLALAKTCSDPWWKMSGIQLVTCMIAHPDETFGPSD